MPTPAKIAVVVILESPGYWLMLKRSYPPNQGLYTPVGGKIEDGESPRAAAIREVQEEVGLQLEDVRYCGLLVDSSPTDYNWICFVYRANVDYFAPLTAMRAHWSGCQSSRWQPCRRLSPIHIYTPASYRGSRFF